MTYDKQKVIDIALGEVGYLEKASKDQLDHDTNNAGNKNYTKYARDLDAMNFYNGRKQSVAWCDVFVDWCFVKAYGKEAALALTCQPTNNANNCGAGCRYSREYYYKKGQLKDHPEPGDQIFFYSKDKSSISHTGLVYNVDAKKVYTVEGNTSGSSGVVANGGGVFKKSYSLTYARIAGYGRPNYGEIKVAESNTTIPENPKTSSAKTTTEILRTLRVNCKGTQVRMLQWLLNDIGYDCGSIDGIFGKKTKAAVTSYQKANGLDADGVVGPKTWSKITA